MMTETGATETTARAVEAQGWRSVHELQKAQEAAAEALRTAQDSHERIEYLAERAEREVRERARREVGAWAAGVKSDPNAVVLAIATTGLEDPVDVVEVVVLGVGAKDGPVRLHERVRPVGHDGGAPVEIEAGATGMHGHTADSLSDAPTFEEVYERLRGALGDGRVIVYNDEYVLRVLTQTVERYWLEPLDTWKFEDAMYAYARAEGEYSVERGEYSPKKLPGGDGTPLGNSRATLALVEKLAAEYGDTVSDGGNGSGGKGQPLDIDESDWEDIPF